MATPALAAAAPTYAYRVFVAHGRPPLAPLASLAQRAWAQDYAGRAAFLYDEAYLRWVMPEGHFFGVLALDERGEPAGLELALERTLVRDGRPYRAFYVTLLSVAPEHRGRGVAQGVLGCLAEAAFDRFGAALVVSTFDAGAAGRPTVERSVQAAGDGTAIAVLPPARVWGATYDLRAADAYEPLSGLSRAALLPGLRRLFEAKAPARESAALGDLAPVPVRRSDVEGWHEAARTFGFAPDGSVEGMYLAPETPDAGVLVFDLGRGARCLFAYHVSTLVRPGLPHGRVGQIQFACPGGTPASGLARALVAVNATLFRRGCLCTAIVDTGTLPRAVLQRAGFLPTDRWVHFAVRGPARAVAAFAGARPPYLVDLL